jgi:hypothetical protein
MPEAERNRARSRLIEKNWCRELRALPPAPCVKWQTLFARDTSSSISIFTRAEIAHLSCSPIVFIVESLSEMQSWIGGPMRKVRSIDALSAGQLLAAGYGLFGIVYLFQALIAGTPTMYAPIGLVLPYLYVRFDWTIGRGVGMLFSSLAYAFSGWVSGVGFALIYNAVAYLGAPLRVRVGD